MNKAVSQELDELYNDYYVDESISVKRGLAAQDSVDHISALKTGALGKLLDVGAGNGSVLNEISKRNLCSEMHALEISASGLEKIKNLNLTLIKDAQKFDGYKIPYTDNMFDTAICIHVMEHVEHERMLLREIGRVSKDIFLEVPLEGGLRGKTNYKYGHINYYTPLSMTALIETSGLEIISSKVVCSSLAYEQHLHGSLKGRIRNFIRNSLLNILGKHSSELMTYLFIAHCRPVNEELLG